MKIFGRDLLSAWLVLLLVTTGIGIAQHGGRVAGAPLWALCGDTGITGIPAPDAPTGHHLCLDCLAPTLAAAPAPLNERRGLPLGFVVVIPSSYDQPAAPTLRGPGIRAPPLPV